ncbi:YfbM family protein [Siccationidurans soli]|uniref:YfbM family protein n=2 Tax=Hymenobacter negativus TaxID=2795026 RepID=A0ABS3QGZ8_9BACT|nr:YfbM family protein [Hymenobacter negativus]
MYCELRQITLDYAGKLLADPDQVLHYVDKADSGRLPKEAQGEDLNLDKAWHGLHYLLTGTDWGGPEPTCYLLAGGAQVGDEEEHDVYGYGPARILMPAQVAAFRTVVDALTVAEIQRRYNGPAMTKLKIYPEIWDREAETSENLEFLEEAASELRAFLGCATRQQQAIILYLA